MNLSQSSRFTIPNPNGVDWDSLPYYLLRERPSSVISVDGQAVLSFSSPLVAPQYIRCLFYTHVMKSERGIEREFPEAVLQHLTHLMICNFVVDNVPNPAQTDIQFMDRMTDSYGNHYRVIAPIDDAGIHHHLLVALETWSPSATGDV